MEVHAAFITYAERGYNDFGAAVGRYVLMPDHLHLFVSLPETNIQITIWVRGLKRALSDVLATAGIQRPFW